MDESGRAAEGASGGVGPATILVVEDSLVSDFLRSVITHRGYRVICAGAGAARALLRREQKVVDLVITNTPLEFSATPDVPLLYVAACPDPEAIRGFRYALALAKPFHPRRLFECLDRLLA